LVIINQQASSNINTKLLSNNLAFFFLPIFSFIFSSIFYDVNCQCYSVTGRYCVVLGTLAQLQQTYILWPCR